MTIHIKKLDMFECTALIHIKKDVELFMCTIMNIEQQQVMCTSMSMSMSMPMPMIRFSTSGDPLLYQR